MYANHVLNEGTSKLHVKNHYGMGLRGFFVCFILFYFIRCSGKKVFLIFLKLIANNLRSRQSLREITVRGGSFLVRSQTSSRQLYNELDFTIMPRF